MEVKIKKPTQKELDDLGVKNWPIWEKEESVFDWHYDETEVCYLLEGKVEVGLPDGKIVKFQKGDFVTFPKGLSCKWDIKEKVRKHYSFE